LYLILDRDGVINHDSPDYIKSPEEWIPIQGSLQAIAKFKQAGYKIFVATNQSGIGRGYYSHSVLDQIHQKMQAELQKLEVSIDGIYYCPHRPEVGCSCRKPLPGLLLTIAKQHNFLLSEAICIGDSLRDLQAAQTVSAKNVLVLTGNGKKTAAEIDSQGIIIYQDLLAAAHALTLPSPTSGRGK
jgi:D-glycero-D-manno-heptose 1,7-bisphosphate phosphatase